MMRLDKYLAECGFGTRSEVKKLVKSNCVMVNGNTARKPEMKVEENADVISVNGEEAAYEKNHYYLLYKPAGCVTAVRDPLHRTVMDILPEEIRGVKGLSPVGRLDLDTEGVLLLTDDGALNHHLMSPAHHVSKTYLAWLDKPVPNEAVQLFAEGIDIGDEKPTLPAKLELCGEKCPASNIHGASPEQTLLQELTCARLTITEGRFHQVKRMFQAVGCEVRYLRREQLGILTLSGMQPGEVRRLKEEEIRGLRET